MSTGQIPMASLTCSTNEGKDSVHTGVKGDREEEEERKEMENGPGSGE